LKFIVRKYFSGFCTYEVDAEDEISAYEKSKSLPIDDNQILNSLEEWEDCNEVLHDLF